MFDQSRLDTVNERIERWRKTVASFYFPLELEFVEPETFAGELTGLSLGSIHLSRLRSDPASYERHERHVHDSDEEAYLITIPRVSTVEFVQLGRSVQCGAGGILIERSDAPYRFHYDAANDLHVVKVARSTLAERIARPDRHCVQAFDGTRELGLLFSTMVAQAQVAAREVDGHAAAVVGRQLLELLGLVLENDPRAVTSTSSAVRAAHLQRAEMYIRANLTDSALSLEAVADACSISKRYLHDLFKDTNETVAARIRQERLIAARDRLEAGGGFGIADIAYQYGFSDQAQFSRLFKAAFGQTPSGFRSRAQGRWQG
ncbi:MAG: helix-turn-helix domain-containing protein [Alphaproteobacteria bacterium]